MSIILGRSITLKDKILVDTLMGLLLVIVGVAGVVAAKYGGDIKLLTISAAALVGGLGVLAAGSVRRDLYEHITMVETSSTEE